MADDRWRGDDWRRDEDRYRYGGPGFGQGWQGYGQGMPGGMGYGQGGINYGPVYGGSGGMDYGTTYGHSAMPYGQSAGYGQGYGYGPSGYGQGGTSGYGSYEQSRYGQGGHYGQDYGRPWSGRNPDEIQRYSPGYRETPDFRHEEWRGSYGSRDYGTSDWRGHPEQERSWWNRASDEVASWVGDEDAERRRRMDQQRGGYGGYYGRGPKGFTRSDDRIREDVNDRLTYDPQIDATEISVSVDKGEVTLSGTVGSRHERRHAEDCAENISGVKHVQNNIRVQDETSSGTTSSGTASRTSTSTGTSRAGTTY